MTEDVKALAASAVPDGWQPIETAPKDETAILIIRANQERVPSYNVVYWNDTDLGTPENPWCFVDGGGAYHKDFPTHWQRLPAVPSPQTGGGEK